MNFRLSFYYYYEKDDKLIEKEMFIWGVYGVITLEIKSYFKSAKSRYENLDEKMKGNRLTFNYLNKLNIKLIHMKQKDFQVSSHLSKITKCNNKSQKY